MACSTKCGIKSLKTACRDKPSLEPVPEPPFSGTLPANFTLNFIELAYLGESSR